MSKRPPVPSLPPLSGITDPGTRTYLDALTNAWLVRNGHTKEIDERFVTVRDLREGFNLAKHGGGGGLLPVDIGGSDFLVPGVIATYIQNLLDSVQTWRIWRLLGSRIDRMETPEWFRGRFGAEVRTEQIRVENATNALASSVTTAITNVNNNVAMARQAITATSDLAGATASAVTTLQTEVNGVITVAQEAFELAASVDGTIQGSWSVRFDLNGYVAGFGLGVQKTPTGDPTSEFVVRADAFAIGSPEVAGKNPGDPINPLCPFIALTSPRMVNGVLYNPGVYMNHAWIADATIDTARIADLTVTTLKIKNFAITASYSVESSTTSSWVVANGTTNVQANSSVLYCDDVVSTYSTSSTYKPAQSVTIFATVVAECDTADTNVGIKFYRGGTVLATRTFSAKGSFTNTYTATCVLNTPSDGELHLQLGYFNDWGSGQWRAKYVSIIALMARR